MHVLLSVLLINMTNDEDKGKRGGIFETLFVLDVIQFEQYDTNIRLACSQLSRRRAKWVNNALNRAECQLDRFVLSCINHSSETEKKAE